MMFIARVVFAQAWSDEYDYYCDSNIMPGDLVQVSLKNKSVYAVVFDVYETDQELDIKHVEMIKKERFLEQKHLDFIQFVAQQNFVKLGSVLKLMIHKDYLKPELPVYAQDDHGVHTIDSYIQQNTYQTMLKNLKDKNLHSVRFEDKYQDNIAEYLTGDQQACVERVYRSYQHAEQNDWMEHEKFLLQGATGSGKTDVYLEIIGKVFKHLFVRKQTGKMLILLPEVSLTYAFVERVAKRFGIAPMLWNHKTSDAAKRAIYYWSKDPDQSGILLGTRSSIFLPFANLRCIIMDEEHDNSYKQSQGLRYQTRYCVEKMSVIHNAMLIFASATPSFELLADDKCKRLQIERQQQHGHAEIKLVDMTDEKSIISDDLKRLMQERLDRNEMTMLFLNRKGYASTVMCYSCKTKLACRYCSVSLVYYKAGTALCHYCGYNVKMSDRCPCGNVWSLGGTGLERIESLVHEMFPKARVAVVHSNLGKQALAKIYKDMQSGKIDIVIGTQMLIQGHHIEHLTLIGILDCDFSLAMPYYNAAERTYQMLTQARGRPGRGSLPGICVIQTYNPNNPMIAHFYKQTFDQWLQQALHERAKFLWPPYVQLLSVVMQSTDFTLLSAYVKQMSNELRELLKQARWNKVCVNKIDGDSDIYVLGPTPSPVMKMKGYYRYRFLIKYHHSEQVRQFIDAWIQNTPRKIKVILDNHPEDFI